MAVRAEEHPPGQSQRDEETQRAFRTARTLAFARRLLPAAEVLGVVVAAPLLLFPNPYSVFALVLLPVLWLARLLLLGFELRRSPADWPLLGLLVMTCVSLYPSVDLGRSLPRLYGLTLGFYVFTAVIEHARSQTTLRALTLGFLLAGVEIAVIGLVGTEWKVEKLRFLGPFYEGLPRLMDVIRTTSGTVPRGVHPNEVGAMLALLFPLALAAIAFGGRGLLFWVGSLSVLLSGLVLFLTGSRSAWFGAALGVGSLVLFRWPRLVWALAPVLVITVAAIWWAGPGAALDSPVAMGSGTSAARIELWSRAWFMIEDFPFTGVGLNMFPVVSDRLYPLLVPDPDAVHAHNTFLQIAVDLGLPGLAAFLALLAVSGVGLVRGRQRVPALAAGVGAGLVAQFSYGLTDAVPLGARHGILIWPMLGIAVALGVSVKPSESPRSRHWAALIPWTQWACFALACGLGASVTLNGLRMFP